MPIVLPTPFLFQRSTNKSRVGKYSNMNFSLLLVLSMALKTVAMPVQEISGDSLMVSQNNANGSPKFRLKVQRNMSVMYKIKIFLFQVLWNICVY
jgi:hypothetical protein